MSKHTPGPWTNLPRHECVPICRQDEAGLSIGFVHSSDPARIAEGFANAKLIAAAPELLLALQLALDALAHCAADKGYQSLQNNAAHAARRAIAKATQ